MSKISRLSKMNRTAKTLAAVHTHTHTHTSLLAKIKRFNI